MLELASGIRDLLKGLREDDGEDDDDNDGDIFGACSEEEDF